MLMNKKLIVLFGLLLCIGFVFSETLQPSDLTWTGSMSVTLDKDTFGAGENITGHIRIANKEEYPIIGGIISLQIAQGEYDYPSQFTTSDNVVFEKTNSNDGLPLATLPEIAEEIGINVEKFEICLKNNERIYLLFGKCCDFFKVC